MGKRKGKRGRAARNARKGMSNVEPKELVEAPHSLVINRGKLGKNAQLLLKNFRKLMEPFTATQLKVQKQNCLKDFIHIAGPLNVSHIVVFTKTKINMYFRILKLPHGPTLTFQIKEYSLIRDVIASLKKSVVYAQLYDHHPLLVLNNFSGEGMHFKLMATTFQNMFPSINVNKARLNSIRRCVLLNYNDDKTIDLRQYAIKVVPTGLSKPVKKLISKKVPDLSNYQNIDDFMQKSGNLSESEAELDTPANIVTLSQPVSSRGNIVSEKSAVRLFELGPRMKLELIKIEDELMSGDVLFHAFVKKTPEEIKAIKEKVEAKKLLKKKRRAEQQKNVEKKAAAAAAVANTGNEIESNDIDEHEEDIKMYCQEVGKDPEGNVLHAVKRHKAPTNEQRPRKKVKFSESSEKCNAPTNINKKEMKFSNDAKKLTNHGKFKKSKNKNKA